MIGKLLCGSGDWKAGGMAEMKRAGVINPGPGVSAYGASRLLGTR